jgi:7-cyano-7-deazaguanine synthase
MNDARAMVLFSGGQDSTTCLAWALDRFARVETIGFDYGQRHRVELEARSTVLGGIRRGFPHWAPKLGDDHVVDLGVLKRFNEPGPVPPGLATLENAAHSTVPGRNVVFLTFAAMVAYRRASNHLVTGVCYADHRDYPDTRDDTMKAVQLALNLGMESRFVVHTPLMWIDKADSWRLALTLGGDDLIALIIEESHTCFEGDREHRHEWGRGCGSCPACSMRAQGYEIFKARMAGEPPMQHRRNGQGSSTAPQSRTA